MASNVRGKNAKPTLEHLSEFLSDLRALGRVSKYRKTIKQRIEKPIVDCEFNKLSDFSADKFSTWRSRQEALGPKTLNDYLNAANNFLNWLVRQCRLSSNPLANITKVDLRGRQQKRRAITPLELKRLLAACRT